MHNLTLILVAVFFAFSFGCSKDHLGADDCQDLLEALANNNKDKAARELDHLLVSYSRSNVEKLVYDIESECDITAALVCYNCVLTNPASSQIRLSFRYANAAKLKFLDIGPDVSNRMRIVAIHD